MTEVGEITLTMLEGLKRNERVESVVVFMDGKSLQVRMTDGTMFNVGIAKTQHKINRKAVYEKGGSDENDSSI